MIITYKLKGGEINQPNNAPALSISINFDKTSPDAEVTINDWEFGVASQVRPNDGARILFNHIDDGLTGGEGIFEGVPFEGIAEENGVSLKFLDSYLDLSKAIRDCDKITAPAILRAGKDWINEVAGGFSFEYLYETGSFNSSEFIPTPYIISAIPDYLGSAVAAISVYTITQQIKEQSKQLAEASSKIPNPFQAPGEIAALIIKIAFIAVLFIAMIKLIKQIFDLLIQPVKYHMAMSLKRHWEIACAHLGLTFRSTIYDNAPYDRACLMPQKLNLNINEKRNGILGFLSPDPNEQTGYFKGTFQEFILGEIAHYNGKVIIDQDTNELRFERRDWSPGVSKYIAPPTDNNEFRYNANEANGTTFITYATDISDRNTIQEYEGTAIQVTRRPNVVNNPELVLMKNLQEVQLPYALGKIKTELTFPEKIFDAFFKVIGGIVNVLVKVVNAVIKVVNAIIKVINKIIKALKVIGIKLKFKLKPIKPLKTTSFGNLIENRIGMLKLHNDSFDVQKVLFLEDTGTPRNNKPILQNGLTAEYIYDNFYLIDSFVPSPQYPNANQFKIYEDDAVPFTFQDFVNVLKDNKLFSKDGLKEGEFINIDWIPENKTASIKYKINDLYTNNLNETKTISNGR